MNDVLRQGVLCVERYFISVQPAQKLEVDISGLLFKIR